MPTPCSWQKVFLADLCNWSVECGDSFYRRCISLLKVYSPLAEGQHIYHQISHDVEIISLFVNIIIPSLHRNAVSK